MGAWQIVIAIAVYGAPVGLGLLVAGRGQKTLTRLPYLIQALLCLAIVYAAGSIQPNDYSLQLVLFGLTLFALFFWGRATAMRLNNLPYSLWWGLVLFVPVANLLFTVFCTLKAGVETPNETASLEIDKDPSSDVDLGDIDLPTSGMIGFFERHDPDFALGLNFLRLLFFLALTIGLGFGVVFALYPLKIDLALLLGVCYCGSALVVRWCIKRVKTSWRLSEKRYFEQKEKRHNI